MTGASWPDPPPWPEVPPPWRPAPPDTPRRPPPGPPWPVVPTVPMPGSRRHDDLFGRLLERRIVMVAGSLSHDVATLATAQLMLLDATGDDPIDLHLSCPDGDLGASSAVADTIDLVGVAVRAWCRGTVGGPALAPLAAATGQALDRIVADMGRRVVLGAGDAVSYGLVHELAGGGGAPAP